MEGFQKFVRNISKDPKSGASSSPSLPETPHNFGTKGGGGGGGEGLAASLNSYDQSRVMIARPPRQWVSLWTCSKLCAIFFVAGVVVGYTLKRRVRRWASRILRRLKDD